MLWLVAAAMLMLTPAVVPVAPKERVVDYRTFVSGVRRVDLLKGAAVLSDLSCLSRSL